jgi:hypothetical protein
MQTARTFEPSARAPSCFKELEFWNSKGSSQIAVHRAAPSGILFENLRHITIGGDLSNHVTHTLNRALRCVSKAAVRAACSTSLTNDSCASSPLGNCPRFFSEDKSAWNSCIVLTVDPQCCVHVCLLTLQARLVELALELCPTNDLQNKQLWR